MIESPLIKRKEKSLHSPQFYLHKEPQRVVTKCDKISFHHKNAAVESITSLRVQICFSLKPKCQPYKVSKPLQGFTVSKKLVYTQVKLR